MGGENERSSQTAVITKSGQRDLRVRCCCRPPSGYRPWRGARIAMIDRSDISAGVSHDSVAIVVSVGGSARLWDARGGTSPAPSDRSPRSSRS